MDTSLLFEEPNKPVSKIHLRLIQLGKKSITMIEGLDDDLDLNRIAKAMRKHFSCAVAVKTDKEDNIFIQLQGDHRNDITGWLIDAEILSKGEEERVIVHGG
jgi:translation initiation factor 1